MGVSDAKTAQLAVVVALQGSKRRLRVGFNAKEQVVPSRHVELIYPQLSGSDQPTRLGVSPWSFDLNNLNQANPTRREWGQLWVLLSESSETIDLAGFAELACGSDEPIQRAVCWLALKTEQDLFRWKQGMIQPRSSTEIRQRRLERRKQSLQAHRSRLWIDQLKSRQPLDFSALDAGHQRWVLDLQSVVATETEPEDLNDELLLALKSARVAPERHELRSLLIDLDQWDPHQLSAMNGTTWSHGFCDVIVEQVNQLMADHEGPRPGDDKRVDLTEQTCFTIDDAETRDIDDAVALERCDDGTKRLWIHIADPGRLIDDDSLLDQEARRRGSSLYLSRGILPMFPSELSTGPFSLLAGQRNPAWSTWVELDADGDIADYGIQRSWVKPRYRLTYEDADELIDFAPPEDADLAELHALLERRRRWRVSQGALLMDLPEGRIRCRDEALSVQITEPGPARSMVAEAMILAGAVAARFGRDHDLALPYRSQLPADLPSPAQLEDLPEGAVRFAAIKRCLSRGLMGTQPAAHFSLGLPAYAQATSPIRRYGDLVVQRQIAAVIDGLEPRSEEDLQELLEQFDGAIREGISIAREDQRHWQQVWFEQHHDQSWNADFLRWLRPQDRLGLIRIESLAMDVAAECPPGSNPGDALVVTVRQVDSQRDQLLLLAAEA